MKKIIVILLVLSMAFSSCLALVSCGGNTDNGDNGNSDNGDSGNSGNSGGSSDSGNSGGSSDSGGSGNGGNSGGSSDSGNGGNISGDENADTSVKSINNIVYSIIDDSYAVAVSAIGEPTELIIAPEFRGYPVKEIAPEAFAYVTSAIRVVIPEGVTKIGGGAFGEASGIRSIELPSTLVEIDDSIFYKNECLVEVINHSSFDIVAGEGGFGNVARYALTVHKGESKLKMVDDCLFISVEDKAYLIDYFGNDPIVTLPESFEGKSYEIYRSAFNGSSFVSLVIPEGVTSIGSRSFTANLFSLTIPSTLTEIDNEAFYDGSPSVIVNNSPLELIAGESGNGGISKNALLITEASPVFSTVGDFVFMEIDGKAYLAKYLGNNEEIILPADFNGNDYEILNAFVNNTKITEVTIPGGKVKIGNYAFKGASNLASVNLGEGLTYIGVQAFSDCVSLLSIILPSTIEIIDQAAFRGCTALAEVINNSSLELSPGSSSNGYVACYASAVHNGSTKLICENDFIFIVLDDGCELVAYVGNDSVITLPESCSTGAYAMKKGAIAGLSKVKKITIPGSVKLLEYNFEDLIYLEEVVLLDGITEIPEGTFYGCEGLKILTLPSTLEEIGDGAFSDCYSLETVVIPDSVTFIDEYAFSYCHGLIEITIPGSVGELCEGVLSECHSLQKVNLGEGITVIGEEAFSWCYYLKSITLPTTVTEIEDDTFYGCISLESITLPTSLEELGESVFDACYSLTEILISDENEFFQSVNGVLYSKDGTTIYVYPQGRKDTSYVIAEGVETIASYAFSDAISLTSITLPSTLIEIENNAFNGCDSLVSITLPEGLKKIGNYALSCENITEIVLPSTLEEIGEGAFNRCNKITTLVIPASVTKIGKHTVANCTLLTSVTFEEIEGWVCKSEYGTTWEMNSDNLVNPTDVARELTSDSWRSYTWTRPQS